MNKVAIIHDWLTTYGGAERVLEQMLILYPSADLFAICDFLPDDKRGFLGGRLPVTSFIHRLPGARKHYRSYLPLMPLAIEQLDLSDYELVISSSHAVAKGVLTGPGQLHISYVHSPMRYAWDLQHQYLRESGLTHGVKGWIVKWLLHKIRLWDLRTVNGVDQFVANSHFIARRIWKIYRREANVIYPPVDVDTYFIGGQKEDFYLTASRMVPYKKIDLIVEAFASMPDKQLLVIGDGPDMGRVKAKAQGFSNVGILGHQPFEVLRNHMQRAKAFVFSAVEDFGIALVEAQACGTPVIALGKGGALETVRALGVAEAPTGVLYEEQVPESLCLAVACFEKNLGALTPIACRTNAQRFSTDIFRERFSALVGEEIEKLRGAA